MFVTCNYSEDKDRERLYMCAWRMQARFHATLPKEDLEALMEIKKAFYQGAQYDTLVASHVERMASYLLRKRAYSQ